MLVVAAAVLLIALDGGYAQVQPIPFFQSLYSFTNGTDGLCPYSGLVLSGTTLYGTAPGGGANGSGTVFAVNTDGTDFRVLYTFSKAFTPFPGGTWPTNLDGAEPRGGLVQSSNTLYGTTSGGGMDGVGTIFRVNPDGTGFNAIHDFTGFDGAGPLADLIAHGSTLYGTTVGDISFLGSVFAVNTDGTGFASLHNFSGADGSDPYADLVLSENTLYGTAESGGPEGLGTVFGVNTDGTGFTVLHTFTNSADGQSPYGGLVLSGNTLYGTAAGGGTNDDGTVFGVNTDGTDFMVLHAFNELDGLTPSSGLVLSGNTLYGTTVGGGTDGGYGTVFGVNTDGTGFTVLHSFRGSDGFLPYAGLVFSNNTLYGTTFEGGTTFVGANSGSDGAIFSITLPSGPAIYPSSVAHVGGQLQFVAGGLTAGATVVLQTGSAPSPAANWVPVATNTATGANMSFSGLSVTNANYRFFRVVEAGKAL